MLARIGGMPHRCEPGALAFCKSESKPVVAHSLSAENRSCCPLFAPLVFLLKKTNTKKVKLIFSRRPRLLTVWAHKGKEGVGASLTGPGRFRRFTFVVESLVGRNALDQVPLLKGGAIKLGVRASRV